MVTTASHQKLLNDFKNVTGHILLKNSAILLNLVETGKLKLQVINQKRQKEDGLTHYNRKRKTLKVTIKDCVANSKFVCWRIAILAHELVHVLHLWTSKKPVYEEDTHGEDWVEHMNRHLTRGGLRECAKKLVSPVASCIYKRYCTWCPPESEVVTERVYRLPDVLEVSPFGGNCLFCFTGDTAINHLKVSEECKNKYVDAYGPQYKCILQKVTNKGKRVQKRVAQNTGPSVCKFCPAAADKLLLVHLRSNPHCKKQYMDHYMCKSEKGMRAEIIKEKAKMRKRKQRGTNL